VKRFDTKSILDRLIQRAQVKEEWSKIIEQGAVGSTFAAYAEGGNELARYMEYLLQEKKWKTARNMTSLTHQADAISRKRERATSAIGYIIVSHTDDDGRERLSSFGSAFFDVDARSDFDNLIRKESPSFQEQAALVPWTCSDAYKIPAGTIFKSATGVEFFSTETVGARPLKEPYSSIESSESKLNDFIRAGGWNGIKYVRVPIMQGTKMSVEFGEAKGDRFEGFAIESLGVEAAANSISKEFFKVRVIPPGVGPEFTEIWREVENIRLAGPYDKVYETRVMSESNMVLIKFGDGVTGLRLPRGARIACDYVESKGESGNVEDKFQITQMAFPLGANMVDPRTNRPSEYLQCLNIVPIMGGRDIEDVADFKVNAPVSYLKSYAIATGDAYYHQIMRASPINLLRLKVFQSQLFGVESFGGQSGQYRSTIENGVLNEVNFARKALLLTAIKANGEKIDDPVNELINPLIMSMHDKYSPNDSFEYVEPNYIRVRPNVVIGTSSNVSDDDVARDVKRAVLKKYSIFVQDFDKPYYYSVVNGATKELPYAKYVELFFEARASVDMAPTILTDRPGREFLMDPRALLAFKFNFDRVFSKDPTKSGFRNFRYNGPYLIRVDAKFLQDPTQDSTFFLFDNRVHTTNPPELMDAEDENVDKNRLVPIKEWTLVLPGFPQLDFFDEKDDLFINRQVRTAQFNFIRNVVTDAFASRMKQFTSDPREIRPLYVDDQGYNKKFLAEQVPTPERMSLGFSDFTSGSECYRKNGQYWNYTKIFFYENYDDPRSPKHAMGYFIAPLFRIVNLDLRRELYDMFPYEMNLSVIAAEIRKTINQLVTIEAYAQPVANDFDPLKPYDIIFSREEDVVAEKFFLVS